MTTLAPDPLAPGGIAGYGRRLRRGETTAEAATAAYLARITALDPKLGAYQHVAAEAALASARALDRLLASGTDLGPLMGVPVAIKDIFAVEGMPVTAGSRLDVADLIGPEGPFVEALRRAGCVILGKVRTVEFALGAVGISTPHGTPWNPWDAAVQRIPGGSSSGPAVAVAAGLCGFAIGSDTGGSVRLPAAFCGTFGLKTSVGLWPTEGVFPLSGALDTIGPLTASAADAALVYATLTGEPLPQPAPAAGLRLGRPTSYFFDGLDDAVAEATERALAALTTAGAAIAPVDLPEAREREDYFPVALPAELIATLGRERFAAGRARMDPVVAARGARGLEVQAAEYLRLERRRRALCRSAAARLQGFAGIVSPSAAILPPPVADFADPAAGLKLALAITQNSQPGNLLDLCGTSTPIQGPDAPLPIGLQILCPPGHDARALAIALALEQLLGPPPRPDLAAFLAAAVDQGAEHVSHLLSFALNHMVTPRRSVGELIVLAHTLGLELVEIRNDLEGVAIKDGTPPERLRAAAEDGGVRILSINALQRFNDWDEQRAGEAAALARYAQACGAGALVLCPVNDACWQPSEEHRGARLREALAALAPILADAGIVGLVEPLGFATSSLRLKAEAVAAIEDTGASERFRLVHDTFHHYLAGEVRMFPEWTGLVHISGVERMDLPLERLRDEHRGLVGRDDRLGTITQMVALMEGYSGAWSFEPFAADVHAADDIAAALAASMHLIDRAIAKLPA